MNATRREVTAGAALLLGLFVAGRLATGFDGLYGQDAYEYLRQAEALGAWLRGGGPPGPSFWPQGHPLACALAGLLLPQPLAAQAVSAGAWLMAFAAGAFALQRLHPGAGRAGTVYWLATFGLAPLLARSAFLVMSDLLGVALLLVGLERALAWRDGGGAARLAGAALALSAAGIVRHAALLLAAPLLLWLLLRARRRRELGLALLAGGLPLALPVVLRDASTLWPSQHPALQAWSLLGAWAGGAPSPDGWQSHPVPQALFAFSALVHPKLMVPGLLLLPFLRRSDGRGVSGALAAGFVLQGLVLLGSPYQQDRHLLTGFAWVPLLLFPALGRLRARWPVLGGCAALAVLLAAQLVLTGWIARTPLRAWRLELAAAERLRQEPAVGLYTFSLTPALRLRGVPQRLHDLWEDDLEDARPGDLVLYAPERFARQWAGRPPATAFAALQARFALRELARLPLDFRLWVLEAR